MQVNLTAPSAKSLALLLAGAILGVTLAGAARRLPLPHIHIDPATPVQPVGPTPKPEPKPDPKPAPKPDWFGWTPDKGQGLKATAASMPRLSQAAPHLLARDASDKRPILLYKAWTDLFADYPHYPAQQIGDCVSFGHAHGNDLLQCVEWVLNNPGKAPTAADIQETDTEFIYGASREIGGMLGPFDGSYGAAAVKAMTQVGMVSRRMLGAEGEYSGRRAKQFGRTGPPADWKAKAAAYKLGSYAQVTTWDELVAALGNGHPTTICTGMGFTLQRDSQGFCERSGRWGHCMVVGGVRFDREGACILQSWGMDTPSGPRALDQPPYSFWVDRRHIEAILSEGDSWALSRSPHFGGPSARGHRRRLPARWRGPDPVREAA
jgi:hypothetical protein